jgi:hypothetical protein
LDHRPDSSVIRPVRPDVRTGQIAKAGKRRLGTGVAHGPRMSRWKNSVGLVVAVCCGALAACEDTGDGQGGVQEGGQGGGGGGGTCDPTCICDGLPARVPHTDFCSACNPFGEIILLQVDCPAAVASFGVCQYELTSSNSTALALEISNFTISVPGGSIVAPTNANLPATNVTITLRRVNDGATQSFIYAVRDTCQ